MGCPVALCLSVCVCARTQCKSPALSQLCPEVQTDVFLKEYFAARKMNVY